MSLRSKLGLGDLHVGFVPQPGATHVLYFTPAAHPGYDSWHLVSVTDWCGNRPLRECVSFGKIMASGDLSQEQCAWYAGEVLGLPVMVVRFGYHRPCPGPPVGAGPVAPAYWITPEA